MSAGPEQVSRAALFGGTTTLIDFAAWETGETLQQTIERRDQDWSGKCYTDYAFHVMLIGAPPPEVLDQIPETIQAGFPSFKMFTTDITPSRRGRRVLYGHIWEVLQRLAKAGGIAAIHAEDDDIVMYLYEKLTREGRTGFENMAEVHNTLSEDLSFRRIIRLAELVGAALYMVHVSAASGVQAVAEARSRGVPIYGETLHQYANHTSEDYKLPNGQMYHTYPSIKGAEDQRALWAGMANGTISTVATDEVCTTLAVKTQGNKIDDTTGGNTGVEPRMGIVYTEGVVQARLLAGAVRQPDLGQRRAHPRALPPEGRHRAGQRRRHRDRRPVGHARRSARKTSTSPTTARGRAGRSPAGRP